MPHGKRSSLLWTRMTALLLGALLAAFFATSFAGLWSAVRPRQIRSFLTPRDLGLAYEAVSFRTADNLTLRGWFIPRLGSSRVESRDSEQIPTIILLHGYPADKGDVLPALAGLADEFNLFLFDFRSFGESEGYFSTAGAREVEDLRAAVAFLKERGVTEVGVWGFSMGGAVALMGAPELPEVKAVVADSSYASLALMAPELYRIPVVKHLFGVLTGLWAKLVLNVNIWTTSPATRAAALRIPVLLIHSTDDLTIPFRHALRIQEAIRENAAAGFWFDQGLAHGQLRPDYAPRIRAFFKTHLKHNEREDGNPRKDTQRTRERTIRARRNREIPRCTPHRGQDRLFRDCA